jgi:hypothetical protein
MRAGFGPTALRTIRVFGERTSDTATGRPRFALSLHLAGRAPGTVVRRREMRVRRRLPGPGEQRLQFGHPCRQALDQRRLLHQQGVLLGFTQAMARPLRHGRL